jgi:wobble nucleotide-excising tRNase
METTLQAENVKEWANNLIQTEVTGIVENTDRIEALEKKINDIDFNNEIHEMHNRVDEVESRIETIEQAKGDSVTETQVAEMIGQAFQAGIDAHYHLKN